MLEYKLTPHHAGIVLWGDFATLHRLHELIHHLVAESRYIEDKEGFVLGLAYDVRQAFQGSRHRDYRDYPNDDRCGVYGVEILWPLILVQVSVLRQAMAGIPTSKLDQAMMFELEYVVESAVRAAVPATADEVIHGMRCAAMAPYIHLDTVLDSRCRYFIGLPSRQRLKVLPRLMETFDPMYQLLANNDMAKRLDAIPPAVFVGYREPWPDFKW